MRIFCGRHNGAVAIALVSALAAAGCAAGHSPGARSDVGSHIPVSRSASASLRLGGLTVRVPIGSVSRRGRLAAAVVKAPHGPPAGMSFAGPVYHVQITPVPLAGPVRLTLAVSAPRHDGALAGPAAALLAFYNSAAARWQTVPAAYDAATRTISATTMHLSVWTALRLDTSKILADATRLLKGFIGLADTTAQPSCPGAAQLTADGIKVTSDSGSLVKWCAGTTTSGAPTLRVADNRSFALETDYPAAWSVQRLETDDPVTSQIITSVAQVLSPAPGGQTSVIIPGGHTVQLTVPAGSSGLASTSPSAEAYLMDAFLYGADTLAMTFDDIPGAPRAEPSRTAKAVSLAFGAKDCLSQIDAIANGDVSSARAAGELFRSGVELAVGCLGDQWKQAYGISGFVGQFIVSVLLWLADGIKLVLDGLRAAIDSAIYWRNYRIALSQTTLIYLPCCGIPGPDQHPQTADEAEDYRPRTISFDATGSHILQNATWQVWNSTKAVAVGTAAINSCEPACAGGHYNRAPVTITFSAPRECGSYWFWSKAVWHFPDSIPPGETQDQAQAILFGC